MLPTIQVFLLVCVYTVFSVEQGEGSTEIVQPKHKPVYVLNGTTFELECIQSDCLDVTWRRGVGEDVEEIDAQFNSGFEIDSFKNTTDDTVTGITNCRFSTSYLKKTDVNVSDTDSYSCRPKYQGQNVSDSFYTTVNVFTITPVDAVLKYYEDATLRCDIKKLTNVPQVEWKKDGEILKLGTKYSKNITNNTLTIHHADETDIGEYICFFTLLNETYSKVVNMYAKPMGKPFDDKSVTYVKGVDMELKCNVWGHPLPTVSWKRAQKTAVVLSGDLLQGLHYSNEILNISNIDYPDGGEYICTATNSYGSSDFMIIVRVKDSLAAVWPFIGIVIQLILLGIIIVVFERRDKLNKQKNRAEMNQQHVTNSTVHRSKEDVHHRK